MVTITAAAMIAPVGCSNWLAPVKKASAAGTVRAWSEQWADDPLPGTYYIRLTTVEVPTSDLGLPVGAEVRVDSEDIGGSAAVDGSLAEPLVPGVAVRSQEDEESSSASAVR